MHFHLPKPLHGWREFAGEVGIIVIGVLIALSAERVAESWQWHERSEEALNSLRGELTRDDAFATEMAVAVPCVDRQLADLEERVARSGATLKPAPNYSEAIYSRYTFRAPSREWPDQVWQSLVAEGVTSHLDPVLRKRVDFAYQYSRENRVTNRQTDALAYRLQLLARPVALDPASRNHLIEEIEEARGYFDDMKLRSNQALAAIRASGLGPEQTRVDRFVAHSGTVGFCRAHSIPLGRAEPSDEY